LNGNAEDFYVGYEILKPGGMIPFHKHHNSEEVVILEEGGATVTVGDKRSIAGPHAIVFIPRETWVSVANTGNSPIHLYGLFSHQGLRIFFEREACAPESH
jgi:mannose-6-phosphate isomerase-like protein (cupin superfamily)